MLGFVRKYFKSWKSYNSGFSNLAISKYDFSKTIYHGVTNLLADMANDIIINENSGMKLAALKRFISEHGTMLIHRYFDNGFVVLKFNDIEISICEDDEYSVSDKQIRLHDQSKQIIVLRSEAYELYGVSDKMMCKAWLQLIDSAGNASQTSSSRLGNLLIFSPRTQNGGINFLSKEEKEDFEKDLAENYGAMRNQKSALVMSQPMDANHISLANVDFKLLEKVRLATLVIATYFKLPVSQVSLIDGLAGNGLSNGGEDVQGDILKYKTFERLFQKTFQRIADDIGAKFTYSLYGKPEQKFTTI